MSDLNQFRFKSDKNIVKSVDESVDSGTDFTGGNMAKTNGEKPTKNNKEPTNLFESENKMKDNLSGSLLSLDSNFYFYQFLKMYPQNNLLAM